MSGFLALNYIDETPCRLATLGVRLGKILCHLLSTRQVEGFSGSGAPEVNSLSRLLDRHGTKILRPLLLEGTCHRPLAISLRGAATFLEPSKDNVSGRNAFLSLANTADVAPCAACNARQGDVCQQNNIWAWRSGRHVGRTLIYIS